MVAFVRSSHLFTTNSWNEVLSSNACAPVVVQGFDDNCILSEHTHGQAHHTWQQLGIGSGAFVASQQKNWTSIAPHASTGETTLPLLHQQSSKQCGDLDNRWMVWQVRRRIFGADLAGSLRTPRTQSHRKRSSKERVSCLRCCTVLAVYYKKR